MCMKVNKKFRAGKRSAWSLVTTLPVVALLVASCSGGNATPSSTDKAQDTKQPEAAATKDWTKEKVELTFYYMYDDDIEQSFREGNGASIQKKYPNITFKFLQNKKGTTLADIIATKTNVDFFGDTQSGVAKLRDVGLMDDLSDLIKKHKVDLSKIEPNAINAYTFAGNGILSGLPAKINSTALYYNKDLFDKFGVPYLTDNMTWEQVFETAKKLTRSDGGTPYYGLGLNISNMLYVNEKVPGLVNTQTRKATLNSDHWKKMMERIVPMATISGNQAANNDLANYGKSYIQFYKDRNIAIQVGNNTIYNILHQNGDGMRWDIATFPYFSDMPNAGPNSSPYGYFISKTSPNREIAFLAIAALLEESAQLDAARTSGAVPVIKNRSFLDIIGKDTQYLKGRNAKGLVPRIYGESIPVDPLYSAATGALSTAFYNVVAGKSDINTALREAEESANQKISTLGK
ncbi:extracellular solute-binding protein [Paenibacillus mesophilus]|nr:extracellular solute-binding protein [Paenibacillus mesophilus]